MNSLLIVHQFTHCFCLLLPHVSIAAFLHLYIQLTILFHCGTGIYFQKYTIVHCYEGILPLTYFAR